MAYRNRRSGYGRRSYGNRSYRNRSAAPKARGRTSSRRRSAAPRRASSRPQEVRIVVEQPGPRPMAETKKAPPRRF